ncbi:MAG: hypothetical protein COV35_00945 [Alphaproteobacteria bacterium CG11_big_fil_rev_8_21_14_0_20_39_49]|nr:MAG: hypothetical protein COV35_00945 [Alphaproteobacteria bacterium CG11_big_fil_rev_8_21_14_0_20_39_49]
MKITEQQLKTLIEDRYLSRGEGYFASGMVELTSVRPDKVTAKAIGTRIYDVALGLKNSTLSGSCTCPAFEDFGPCKHMAAAEFAVIANNNGGYEPSEEFQWRKDEISDFEKFFKQKSKEELISIIMQLASENPELMYMLGYDGEY